MDTLVSAIIKQLESELATAITASQEAHSSATHTENVADNKYDTLALEAAYLAHGQSVRIAELEESIRAYKHFKRLHFDAQSSIQIGALVDLENENGDITQLFIGPCAGGLCLGEKPNITRVITPATPLGKALLHKSIDDDIELKINHQTQYFTVIDIR